MSILVISNNFLSDVTNNGKTLKFLLSKYRHEDIYWVYTTPLRTDSHCGVNRLVVKPFQFSYSFDSSSDCYQEDKENSSLKKVCFLFFNNVLKKTRSWIGVKLIRELFFYFKVRKVCEVVVEECRGSDIEKIVFVAGDFAVLHLIAAKLKTALNVPLHVFVTDDYVFEYQSGSSYRFRRGVHENIIINAFRNTLTLSSFNSYISDKMRAVYRDSFGANGDLSFNSVNSLKLVRRFSTLSAEDSRLFRVRYFGSVHSGRLLALERFLDLVDEFNAHSRRKLILEVFSVDPAPQSIKCAKFRNLINWFKPLSGEALQAEIANSDALALIESDRIEDLRKTWLSFSTKVMEYLGSGKPIVAFGSLDNPSIQEVVMNDAAVNLKSSQHLNFLFDEIYVERIVQNGASLLQLLEEKNTFL